MNLELLFGWIGLTALGVLNVSAARTGEDLDPSLNKTGDGLRLSAKEEVRILLVGDSTVASYPTERPVRGWGQLFPEYFDARVSFRNAAVGGRSSKSFIAEGHWEKAIAFKPNFVFIQFGHNDQPNKGPERETDPAGSYRDYLRRYIRESRAIGAQPVLVTSVARRTYHKNGTLSDSLQPWVDAMKAVGSEESVPVIDLHTASMDLYRQLGDEGGTDLNCEPADRSHFSEKGARIMAGFVAKQIPEKVPALVPYLRPLPNADHGLQ